MGEVIYLTTFHEIYDSFLLDVVDKYFIDYDVEEINYEDLQRLLITAIVKFKHPKQNLKDYDLLFVDEEGVNGQFNVDLTLEEVELLVNYMGIAWATNKLKRGRITELQYTGSDAKVINIKTYIEGIKEIIKTLKEESKVLNNSYQMHCDDKIKLNKKESIRNNIRNRNGYF